MHSHLMQYMTPKGGPKSANQVEPSSRICLPNVHSATKRDLNWLGEFVTLFSLCILRRRDKNRYARDSKKSSLWTEIFKMEIVIGGERRLRNKLLHFFSFFRSIKLICSIKNFFFNYSEIYQLENKFQIGVFVKII